MIEIKLTKQQQQMIVCALRVLADEYTLMVGPVVSETLKQGFLRDANELIGLAQTIERIKDTDPNIDVTCARLIIKNQFIDAIKLRREQTNEPLKEAKEYCDRLRDELRAGGCLNYSTTENRY